jgi:hypothetical protein
MTSNPLGASRSYDVSGTSREDEALRAVDSRERIPQDGETHPLSALLRVTERTASQVAPNYWRVSVRWTIPDPGDLPRDAREALNEFPEVSWSLERESEAIDRDAYGNPIINAAGDAFDPPLTEARNRRVLTILVNEPFYDLERAAAFENRVNLMDWRPTRLATIGLVEKYTMQCLGYVPVGSYQLDPVPLFYRCQYQFVIDPLGFARRLLNQGTAGWYQLGAPKYRADFYQFNGDSKQSERVTNPIRLDPVGKPISTAFRVGKTMKTAIANPSPLPREVGVEWTQDRLATFLIYQTKFARDFAELGF